MSNSNRDSFSLFETFIHTQGHNLWFEQECFKCFLCFQPSVFVLQMTLLKGNVAASGGFAYVSQQAWILNDSLKENILFGNEDDQDK